MSLSSDLNGLQGLVAGFLVWPILPVMHEQPTISHWLFTQNSIAVQMTWIHYFCCFVSKALGKLGNIVAETLFSTNSFPRFRHAFFALDAIWETCETVAKQLTIIIIHFFLN